MTVIVSGYPRTGTTMMMLALIAGGATCAFDLDRQAKSRSWGNKKYKANSKGLFEIDLEEYGQPGFPGAHEGKLIKIMTWALPAICAGEYNIVLMMRDPEEIRQSIEASTGQRNHPEVFAYNYIQHMNHVIGIMRQRKDVKLHLLDYRLVIDSPVSALKSLGLDIDLTEAAATVDPDQCRFKRENLEFGV